MMLLLGDIRRSVSLWILETQMNLNIIAVLEQSNQIIYLNLRMYYKIRQDKSTLPGSDFHILYQIPTYMQCETHYSNITLTKILKFFIQLVASKIDSKQNQSDKYTKLQQIRTLYQIKPKSKYNFYSLSNIAFRNFLISIIQMNKLSQLVRYFLPPNPFKPLFNPEQLKLDQDTYENLYQQLTTGKNKKKYQQFIQKQKLTTLSSLRLLFLYFYTIRNHTDLPKILKEASWKPVSSHYRLRERYHAVQTKTIQLLQDYFEKIQDFSPPSQNSLVEKLKRCQYILEILEICAKLEFNLAYRINVPSEPVFQLIYKYLLKDSMTYIAELCDFVHKYCDLILEDHSESLSINSIYEKTIYYHREAQKLQKFISQPIQIPKLNFDVQHNRKIQQKIKVLRGKYLQNQPKKLTSIYATHTNGTHQDSSLVKLCIP